MGAGASGTRRFTFVHDEGSAEERGLLQAAEALADIPGVEAFELLAEVSPKNGYRFGISMEFADRTPTIAITSTLITSASCSSAGYPK